MLTIIDYGVGNLASMKNMLKKAGYEAVISSDSEMVKKADKLILPGVGAFDTCAGKLRQSGLLESITHKVAVDKIPVLGVCVGMQLLLEGSEEGVLPGLGWVKGRVVKFDSTKLLPGYKIPHMGWSEVMTAKYSRLFEDMYADPRFYFVHSFHAQLIDDEDALVFAEYGYRFVAGLEKENILGVQFHPEKSHKFGMKLLSNFVKYY